MSDSTWGSTSVTVSGARDFVKGLQDDTARKNAQALKVVERALVVGIGVWGLQKLRGKK